MEFQEIYNLLLAGKKLQLAFTSVEDAEGFRVRLAQFKARQDASMLALGMAEKAELQQLSFKYSKEAGNARIEFKNRVAVRQYEVVILEEEDTDTLPLPGTEASSE